MTFWPLTNSDLPTNQTFHQFHDLYTELDLHRIMSGFHGAFATGVASQQGTLTLPDTWFRPPFWDLLMLQLLRPNSSNLPCLCSTFHIPDLIHRGSIINGKRKRKRSDSVLWQKPLHQQKCQKGKVTTQTTPQKSSIKQRLRTDLGRSKTTNYQRNKLFPRSPFLLFYSTSSLGPMNSKSG